jgi:hypothetical protein
MPDEASSNRTATHQSQNSPPYCSFRNSSALTPNCASILYLYFVEERWSDLAAAMNGDRDRPSVLMNPALVTSSLMPLFKTKPHLSSTKLLSAGARHSRSRCCLPAFGGPCCRIRPQSFQRLSRVRTELLLGSASAHSNREWQGLPPPSRPAGSGTRLLCSRQDSSHTQSTPPRS